MVKTNQTRCTGRRRISLGCAVHAGERDSISSEHEERVSPNETRKHTEQRLRRLSTLSRTLRRECEKILSSVISSDIRINWYWVRFGLVPHPRQKRLDGTNNLEIVFDSLTIFFPQRLGRIIANARYFQGTANRPAFPAAAEEVLAEANSGTQGRCSGI